MKNTNLVLVAVLSLICLTACEKKEKTVGEKIGETVDEAFESPRAKEIRRAAREIADETKRAAKKVSDDVKKAAEELKEDSP